MKTQHIFKKQKYQHKQRERGVVLLIAILISSVALAVGIGVYTRTYKELLFSTFWKESQRAFGAADTGLECGMYWDLHSSSPLSKDCVGNNPVADGFGNPWNPAAGPGVQNFQLNMTDKCALVTVEKFVGGATHIKSRGQSELCSSTNPRRVERTLEVFY